MKLLIVSQHFFPDNFRINEIASELVKRGHDVTVLTSLPDYKTGKVPKDCRGLRARRTNYHGVKIIRCFSVSRRSGVIFRALNYFSFMLTSTLKCKFLKQKYDLVMCYQTSPIFMANAARATAKKQKIPFLIYCLDLWPESLKAWHVGEKSFIYKAVHSYSKKIYNSADLIAVTSKPFVKYLNEINCVEKQKMVYLPQHSDDMNLPFKTAGENEDIVFAFGGNIGSVQNVECIIKAATYLRDVKGFSIEIYGDGSELEHCKQLSNSLKVNNIVHFHGRVDRKVLWEEYKKADAFLLTLKSEGFIGQTIPAKLQEYMSGNRPVFASIDGAASELIKESGCGVCVPSDSPELLAEKMRDFVLNGDFLKNAAKNGRACFEKQFTLESFITNLENHISALKGGH